MREMSCRMAVDDSQRSKNENLELGIYWQEELCHFCVVMMTASIIYFN